MFHFSADRLAGLDSMVLKISASPKVPPIIPNHTLNHNPSTNIKKLRKCNNRRANRTPLADKTTSSNVPPHVPPREKISSSMLLGNLCCAPNELNITPSKQATPPTVRHSLADANSFRPLPPLPSASTLQLPSFLNFSTQSFASPSGARIQRSTSSLPGSVLFRLSSTPVSSYRRVVIRKTKNKKVYEGPHWIPAFHHPNSPYVPWTTPVRRRILPPPSPSCTLPTPYSDHHSRSGAVAPEPWTADFCLETPKKSRRGKLANSWKKFKNSVKRGVQNVVSCIGKSRKSRVNCATQDVVTPCSENVAIIDSPSPSTRPWSTRSRCSLKSFASSDSTTLAAWLAERRTAASGIADEPGGEVSVEEYELMGSWLDLHQGDGGWVCGVRDCDLHTPGGSPNAIRGRLKVFRTGMPFDGPDLLLTPPQPSTPCPSFSSEFIATPARFWSLPRLPSHAVDMAISTCNGSPRSSLDAERRLVNQKSRELTMPGGWTLC